MKEMKKNFRKITSLVIALAVMVTAVVFDVPGTVVAEAAASGTSADGLTWTLDDSGTLTISGSGAMANYSWVAIGQKSSAPWGGYKTDITAIVIENGVKSIGNYAFYNLTNVETISIADSVTSIGTDVFRECSKIETIVIPSSVTTIGRALFQKCTSLQSISIPESVTYLGGNAFDDCTSLLDVTISGSLEFISNSTFRNCTSLKSVTIPSKVTSIGDYAFINCSSLTSITIPNGVTDIGAQAFSGCGNLTSITIPNDVTSIGNSAFKDCTALNTATFECIDPPALGGDAVFTGAAVIEEGGKIYVPCGAVETYKTADNWSAYASVITNNGHKVAKRITAKDPTCTETGNEEYWTCGCGEEKYSNVDGSAAATDVIIDELGHDYKTDWSMDAANHWYECTRCQDKKDSAPHTWGDWTVTTPATEESKGEEQHECSVCHTTEERETPVLTHTHTMTHVPEVSATETTEGTKEHWHCAGCNKDFADENGTTELTDLTIPPLGHTHTLTYVPEDPATETTEGIKEHWHCAGCGKDFADENGTTELTDLTIPSLGHTHTLAHVPEAPATETTEGTKEHWHCEGCGKNFADENGENEITVDDLKIGRIEKVVQTGENAPETKLETPLNALIEAVLTSEEKESVREGADIKIVLTVDDAADIVPAEDKTAVETVLGSSDNYKLGQYLDVNLLKIIDGEQEKITETSALITITFEIPAELRGSGRTYSVIRVHGGATTVLPDLDNDENTVTIRSDKFSTYALAYLEANTSNPGGGRPGGSIPGGSIPNPTPAPSGGNSGTTNGSDTSSSGDNSSAEESGSGSGNSDTTSGRDSAGESNSPVSVDDPSDDGSDDDSSDDEDDFSDVEDDSSDIEEDSSAEEGNSESGNSDQAVNAFSEDTAFSVDGEDHVSGESDHNPSTGVGITLIPFTMAFSALFVMTKRRRK